MGDQTWGHTAKIVTDNDLNVWEYLIGLVLYQSNMDVQSVTPCEIAFHNAYPNYT